MRRHQSRLESILEAVINIATGFLVSYVVWLAVVPVFWPQHQSNFSEAFGIVALFTIASLLRQYFWRRFFEREIHVWLHKRLL